MEILNVIDACFMAEDDDLLNFTLDGEGLETDATSENTTTFSSETQSGSLPEYEELEWLLNKDAFPAVDTCFPMLSDDLELMMNHESPVSVLENSSSSDSKGSGNLSSVPSCCEILKIPISYPVRARSKRRRRRSGFGEFQSNQSLWLNQVKNKNQESIFSMPPLPKATNRVGPDHMGRKCLHCGTDKTPQWRAGPLGPKTLCNACGVRYKSGRLLPEYRPASSPTFSRFLHSNSHRKVVEMRTKKKITPGGGTVGSE